jgi:REP element-mobilizing transposase RayT
MALFNNKYRIESARLQSYDYASEGAYFITICTKNRVHYFGEIVETQFIASELGQIAEKIWEEIPKQFPFIELGEFVIMPNHTHGILIIKNTVEINTNDSHVDADSHVETRLIASLPTDIPTPTKQSGGFAKTKNPMFHDNISRVIRWYKGRCTFEMRKIHADFEWQSRFHDHIIRNTQSFETIQNYIATNAINWDKDKFNPSQNRQ